MPKEQIRLSDSAARTEHWKRWGPYLSERAWGTVREDYSPYGNVWESFPHDHARSRAYRWNEDGLAGISDRHQYICFALALWNEQDPILKERLFGLTARRTAVAKRTSRNSSCSIQAFSTTIVISMCSSNMQRAMSKTFLLRSQQQIVDPRLPRCACSQLSGSGICGLGFTMPSGPICAESPAG